jgi:hypothetical protein
MNSDNPKKAWRFLILPLVLLITAVVIGIWLKQGYEPREARATTEQFIDLLYQEDFKSAYQLTSKSGYVGKTETEFTAIAERERCSSKPVFVSTFPFQSNGNRLRRWYTKRTRDMEIINIEFRDTNNTCLLGITIKQKNNQTWRVIRFGRHAG